MNIQDAHLQHTLASTPHDIPIDTFVSATHEHSAGTINTPPNAAETGGSHDIQNIAEQYLNPTIHAAIPRDSTFEHTGGYDYIEFDVLPETTEGQSAHSSHVTSVIADGQSSDLHGQDMGRALERKPDDQLTTVTTCTNVQTTVNTEPDVQSVHGDYSSNSSSSDSYLRPVSNVASEEGDGSGYDYADVANVQVHVQATQLSSYAGLGTRPPYIPTVYDRLRSSRLCTDSDS